MSFIFPTCKDANEISRKSKNGKFIERCISRICVSDNLSLFTSDGIVSKSLSLRYKARRVVMLQKLLGRDASLRLLYERSRTSSTAKTPKPLGRTDNLKAKQIESEWDLQPILSRGGRWDEAH